MEQKRLGAAASYLRIIQALDDLDSLKNCVLKLLEEALTEDQIELAGDLIRFLRNIQEDGFFFKEILILNFF